MPKKSFVVRSSADGWMVMREGKKSPESMHRKKDVAVRKGRSLAKRAGGSHVSILQRPPVRCSVRDAHGASPSPVPRCDGRRSSAGGV